MPTVIPFRGLRYDPLHVGNLSQVITPPYDDIDSSLQDQCYEQHPANVIRLECNRDEPGDNAHSNKYTRAARFLRQWQKEGVLIQEPTAAFYVYHQEFQTDGRTRLRSGFLARVRLEPFGAGSVYPHEETTDSAKQDRLLLTRACMTNISPVLGLYPDPQGDVQSLLDEAIKGQPHIEATDAQGVRGMLWPVTDETLSAKVSGLIGPHPTFIADGHNRYETACNYRDEVATCWTKEHNGQPFPADHPANYVLMMLVRLTDPGLMVMPSHRLFTEAIVPTAVDLHDRLSGCFQMRTLWKGPEAAKQVWSEMEFDDQQGTLGIYTAGDKAWTLIRLNDHGQARMEQLASTHSPTWRALGVSILHHLLVGDLLAGKPNAPPPQYVHQLTDVVDGIGSGQCQMAALVMPPTIGDIRTVSDAGERMPTKSTYFFPKLTSGIVLNPLT